MYNTGIYFRNVIRMKINPNLAHFSTGLYVMHTKSESSNLFPIHSIFHCSSKPLCSSSFPGLTGPSAVNLCWILSAAQQCTQRETTQNQTQVLQSRKQFKKREVCSDLIHRKSISTNVFLRTPDFL